MATEQINIEIREDGSRVVTVNVQGIGAAAEKSGGQVDLLKRALGLLGAALAIDKVTSYADAWASANGIIAIATKSAAEAAAVQGKLFQAAEDTRQSFDALVDLYRRVSQAQTTLGASQNQMIQFTKEVGEALVIQHITAESASGALLQLGHALDGGKVNAREFNSITLQLGSIMQVAADHIKGTGGTIAGLRSVMNAGKLSSTDFFNAILAGSADLQARFAQSASTFGQGVTVITNALEKYIGELNTSIGAGEKFAALSRVIAANMNTLATAVLAVGAAVAVAFAPAAVEAFGAAVLRLFTLLNANPLIALASIVAGLIVYFKILGDTMNAGIDSITTYNDVFRAFGEEAQGSIEALGSAAFDVFEKLSGTTFPNFFADTRKGFAGFLQSVARVFDSIGGLLTGLGISTYRVVSGIPDLFENAFDRAYNLVVGVIENMINEVITGINKLREVIGSDPIELVNLEKKDVDQDALKKYGENIANGIDDGFKAQGQFLENSLNDVFDKAQAIAKARVAAIPVTPPVNLDSSVPGVPTPVDPKKVQAAENALRQLLNLVEPAAGAVLDLAKAQVTLNNAVKFGLIDRAQANVYLGEAERHYRDIIDPYSKMIRNIQTETNALGVNTLARATDSETAKDAQELADKGQKLSQKEIERLHDVIQARNEYTRVVGAQDTLVQNSVVKRQAYVEQLAAIEKLLSDPVGIGFNKDDAAEALLASNQELVQGTKIAVDGTLAQYKRMYEQIQQLRDKNLISETQADQLRIQQSELLNQKFVEAEVTAAQARLKLGDGKIYDMNLVGLNKLANGFTNFTAAITPVMADFFVSLENGFADSIGKAIVGAENLSQALRNVAKDIVSTLISALIKLGLQWVASEVLKETASTTALATQTTASVAAATATSTAWAVPAGLVNAATFGASADAGLISLNAIMGEAAIFGALGGKQSGGYTGDGPVDQIAGVYHGQEYVVNAEGTAKYRDLLEAMNSGRAISSLVPSSTSSASGSGGKVNVQIINNGTNKQFEVKQLSANDVRVIASDVVSKEAPTAVATQMADPNSKVSKAVSRHTTAQRQRSRG